MANVSLPTLTRAFVSAPLEKAFVRRTFPYGRGWVRLLLCAGLIWEAGLLVLALACQCGLRWEHQVHLLPTRAPDGGSGAAPAALTVRRTPPAASLAALVPCPHTARTPRLFRILPPDLRRNVLERAIFSVLIVIPF